MSQDAQLEDLPHYWQGKIARYRRDCAKYRIKLRDAKAELAALNSELGR